MIRKLVAFALTQPHATVIVGGLSPALLRRLIVLPALYLLLCWNVRAAAKGETNACGAQPA